MVRKNNFRIFLKFDEWKSSIHIIRKNEANEVYWTSTVTYN